MKGHESMLERTEMRMVRWVTGCVAPLSERKKLVQIRGVVKGAGEVVLGARLLETTREHQKLVQSYSFHQHFQSVSQINNFFLDIFGAPELTYNHSISQKYGNVGPKL